MAQASVLSKEEIMMIFQLYDREIVKRHRATVTKTVFAVGIYTGLRINEILNLKINDVYKVDERFGGIDYKPTQNIDIVRKNLLFKRSKKKSQTIYGDIPLNSKLRVMLYEYRNYLVQHYYHNLLGEPWLFPGRTQKKALLPNVKSYHAFSDRAVNNDFALKGKLLSIPQFSTHSMRRTALTQMHRSGVDLRTLQFISGHENLKDLQLYLEVDIKDVQSAIEQIPY